MAPDEEIADIETRMVGMSFGNANYLPLNQRLLALRAAQNVVREESSEQARKEAESQWYKKPLGLIAIGTAISVLSTITFPALSIHFGISL